jgi:DNA modification methylase
MTEAEKRAYVLADNKLAENAGWDRELLAIELRDLVALDPEFDLTITGFEAAEADLLIQGIDVTGSLAAADQVPEINESEPPVSRLGDMWRLGDHRLTCADATDTASFAPLLEGKQAQMVFVDPPYNVPIDGHVSGNGSIKHREFAMASGEMSEEEFVAFLTITFGNLITHSSDGSIHFICIDWRHLWEVLSALRKTYAELKNLCVWNKDNGGQGSLYRSKHELILVAKNGTKPHINNVGLGRFGRNRTNVWNYPGVNSFRKNRLDDLAMHPTVKPVAMIADAILDCSRRGAIVLDCFGGSGTTLMAAEKTGRRGHLMELDPKYVDVTVERFRTLTGKRAVHTATGLTFEETRQQRAKEYMELSATVANEEEE